MTKLIHFTATWCQPCKKMAPVIDDYIRNNPTIQYEKIDVDDNSEMVEKYEIRGVPTFIILKDEEVSNRHTGIATPEKFAQLFDN